LQPLLRGKKRGLSGGSSASFRLGPSWLSLRRPSVAVWAPLTRGRRRSSRILTNEESTCGRVVESGSPAYAWRCTSGSSLSLTRSRAWAELGLSFAYALSLPIVVLLLLVVGIWGGVGLFRARVRGRPLRPRHRAYVLVGCVALASFTLTLGLARALPRPLPTRSHLQRFDRAAGRTRDPPTMCRATSRHDRKCWQTS